MNITYQQGEWFALVSTRAIVVLPPDATADLVDSVWASLETDVTLGSVVDGLTRGHAGSFADIPPFVAIVRDGDDARIAVRGGIEAHVSSVAGTESFTGADVTTWSERFAAGVTGIEIVLDEGIHTHSLPIGHGIVRAARIVAGARVEAPATAPVLLAAAVDVAPVVVEAPVEAPVDRFFEPAEEPVAEPEVEAPVAAEPVFEETVAAPEAVVEPEPEPEPIVEHDPFAELGFESEQAAAEPEAPALVDVPASPAPEEQRSADHTLMPSEVTISPSPEDIDQLWGQTVHRPPVIDGTPPLNTDDALSALLNGGDHDGATISVAQARALRESRSAQGTAAIIDALPLPPVSPPPVPPAFAASSATGGASGEARIRMSTGQIVLLDRTIVIGRRPRSTRASGASLPHLIAVDSPQQDISRSHLEIRPEGDSVMVVDLHTTNGSTLLRPGNDPVRLHPGEQTMVITGDTIDLGDGVTVLFEELP